MYVYDPIGRHRLSFLHGQPELRQYRLLLSFYGIQPHGKDVSRSENVLFERIYGTQRFVDALVTLYGELPSPLDLTLNNFTEVVALWSHSQMSKNEFALRAKVAAWLCDLLVDQDVTPYQEKIEANTK